MKIAFLGAGATGSVFASYLKLGGADDIWLIDLYKEHMDTVRDKGLIMKDHNGEHHLTGFHTAYKAEEVGPVDVLVVLTKSTHTIFRARAAASRIRPPLSLCRTVWEMTWIWSSLLTRSRSAAAAAVSARFLKAPASACPSPHRALSTCTSAPLPAARWRQRLANTSPSALPRAG